MTDSQNLTVELDFGFDGLAAGRFQKTSFQHDYTKFEKIEVKFSDGKTVKVNLGALVALSIAENYRVILEGGYLIMVDKYSIHRTEKSWKSYQEAITELKANGKRFKLSSTLYPWMTFKAE